MFPTPQRAGREQLRGRLWNGWIEHPRLGGDPRKRYAADPGPGDGADGPVRGDADADYDRRRAGPDHKQRYERDPRWIARKAELYLTNSGVADTAYFGAEAEFFIFDNVSFDQNQHEGYYFIDAEEGRWNSGRRENNLGYRPRYKEGYFPVPPTDHYQDLRSEMVQTMIQCGLHIECHHHEVATGGQAEIDQRFDKLVKSADNMMLYKYIVRNTANQYGKTATFMPKPLFGDNGSGMHTHQSLWKGGVPLFAGDGYAGFSQMGLHYIAGLLKHARALAAIIAPTTNSYKRLVPGTRRR